ncbi:MAG TPA: hypothetical protein PK760_15105, partial [Flavobacteriales bacterium]|nr:hypothetical protein [Flavobacteriales bacterium]
QRSTGGIGRDRADKTSPLELMQQNDLATLRKHIPEAAWPPVLQWLQEHPIHVRVVKPRKTKLGDYWMPRPGRPPRITVNNDLNPYAFLVTLVHEFAHHSTWLQTPRTDPHGAEWRLEYRKLMQPFLSPAVLPPDVLLALQLHLLDASASSCTDVKLMRALLRHEPDPVLVLERLPERTLFHFRGSIYVKGPRLRKRYKCRRLNDRRIYLIDPLIEVHVHDPAVMNAAS